LNKHIRWQTALGVGIAYALAVGLLTLPASLHLSRRLIGNNIDDWIFYWNNWWLERAIGEGHDWFFTPYLFYPQGTSLVAHSNSFLNSLAALALKPLMGPVAAYNLVFLFGLWVGAVGMFLLVYELTRRSYAALLAGFIFAFAPYHLTQLLAHAHLGSIHWWPFYVLFLRRALRSHRVLPHIWDTACAGLFAALTLWSGLQLAMLLALWTVLYTGWHLLRETGSHARRGHSCLRVAGIAGLVGVIALVLSAPMVLAVLKDLPRTTEATTAFEEGMSKQTDLLAYLLPPHHNPLAGPYVLRFYEHLRDNRKYIPYLGYTVVGLALVSPLSGRKEAKFWLLSTGFWIVLAAGSAPRLNGIVYTHIPLPYRYIGCLFPISTIHSPDRFNLLVVLSLAVSAGLGTAYLAGRRRWLLVPLAFLVFAEYLCIPLPMWDLPPASPFFEQMAQEPEMYGVVDYPMGYQVSKLWLYYQTLHGKPLVEGHVSRYTLEDYAFVTSQPLLRTFYRTATKPPRLPGDAFSSDSTPISALGPALRSLNTSGVRYILLHKPDLDATLETHFRRALPVMPTYEDSTLAVYDTAHPMPVYYDRFPVLLTPDVALTRFDVQHDDMSAEWQLEILANPLVARIPPRTCQVQLTGEENVVWASAITFFGRLPGGETWEIGDLEVREVAAVLPEELEPGAYRWGVICPGAAAYTAPETLEVHPDGHITYLRPLVDVQYGDVIHLLGYRWRTVGSELHVMLWWKALQAPRTDYKVFLHLLNADRKIVRQYDAMPCNWQCPTSQWQTGEIIADQAIIPLGGVPPGEYLLAVGLYVEETQERLPVQGPDGERYPDNYFPLPGPFVISANHLEANTPSQNN